jgi:hypothetical protein
MRTKSVVKAAPEGAGGALDVEAQASVPDHEGSLEGKLRISLRGA